jgi:predicted TIM-barrel fold metal-dependent hydrolase
MQKLNITKSILSISSPGTHLVHGDHKAARDLARSCNDFASDLVSQYPSKLGFWASLPLPDVAGSLEEIAHAFDNLNADGIALETNHHGVYLGDPKFASIFEELDKRHAKVFIHPTTPCVVHGGHDSTTQTVAATPLTQFPNPVFEFLFDTARALINLFVSGTVSRCPNITFIIPHAGGALLPLIERFTSFNRLLGTGQSLSSQVIKDTFARQFYFDLAGFPFPDQIKELLLYVKTDRLLYGSDYPFTPERAAIGLADVMAREMAKIWEDEKEREMILSGNARSLLS